MVRHCQASYPVPVTGLVMLWSGTVRRAILYRDRSCDYSKDPEDDVTVEAIRGSISVELD